MKKKVKENKIKYSNRTHLCLFLEQKRAICNYNWNNNFKQKQTFWLVNQKNVCKLLGKMKINLF